MLRKLLFTNLDIDVSPPVREFIIGLAFILFFYALSTILVIFEGINQIQYIDTPDRGHARLKALEGSWFIPSIGFFLAGLSIGLHLNKAWLYSILFGLIWTGVLLLGLIFYGDVFLFYDSNLALITPREMDALISVPVVMFVGSLLGMVLRYIAIKMTPYTNYYKRQRGY